MKCMPNTKKQETEIVSASIYMPSGHVLKFKVGDEVDVSDSVRKQVTKIYVFGSFLSIFFDDGSFAEYVDVSYGLLKKLISNKEKDEKKE